MFLILNDIGTAPFPKVKQSLSYLCFSHFAKKGTYYNIPMLDFKRRRS